MRPANPYNITRWGIGAFASLALPAAAVFLWREAWWPPIAFILWTIGATALYIGAERVKLRRQNVRMLEHARKSSILMLTHHRHDWMNDLQILYGYIKMNKADKAVDIVERIRLRMEQDSKVSQLGQTELSTYLLSFRSMCNHLRLEVNVSGNIHLARLSLDADRLTASLIGMINGIRYRTASLPSGDNALRLSLSVTDDAFIAVFAYEGEWPAGYDWTAEAETWLQGIGHLTEEGEAAALPGSARTWRVVYPLTA